MRVATLVCCGLGLCVGLGSITGCSTARYQGNSPSARTFSESPGMRDYYVGMNFNFSVDRPTEYHPKTASDNGAMSAGPGGPTSAQTSDAPVAAAN